MVPSGAARRRPWCLDRAAHTADGDDAAAAADERAAPARRPRRGRLDAGSCPPARQRRGGVAGRLLAAALCALVVLPRARAQLDVPKYTNVSRILRILGDTWRGSGYDDNGEAHYLFRPLPPEDMTGKFCAACSGSGVVAFSVSSTKCRPLLASSGRALILTGRAPCVI